MNEKEILEVPASWVVTTLGEITKPNRPRHQPRDFPNLPFIGMEHIEAHSMKLLGTIPAESMKSGAVHFWPGDVLYGRLRPYLNKVYCPSFEGLCSAEFLVFPSCEYLFSRYLQFLLNSSGFVSFASHLNEGDRPRVDFSQLTQYPFPLPPLRAQHRIASEIEKQLSRLESATVALRRVQAKIALCRASVLKAAVEGRLVPTEAELALAEGRGYEPADRIANQIHDLPDLAEGWSWARLDQLLESLRNGISTKPAEQAGVPILRISAVRPLRVHLEDVRFLPPGTPGIETALLENGDLLFTRYNGNPEFVGVCAEVRNLARKTVYPDKLIRVRVNKNLFHPSFLEIVVNTGSSRAFLAKRIRTTAGQAGISGSDLRAMPVPVAPFPEQLRIAAEVQRQLSIISATEAVVDMSLQRAKSLRQAVLRHAFEGKLAPQDPSDPHASVLLEQIRKARESAADIRPRRGHGVKPGVSTPGREAETPHSKPHRGDGGVRESSVAPTGLADELGGPLSLGLKPQALRNGPAGTKAVEAEPPRDTVAVVVPEPPKGDMNFLDLPREEQIDHVWESLLGEGPLEKDAAIRIAGQILRDRGLVRFQRLREDGPLYAAIAAALERGIREGSFDRPKRGLVRALLPDAKDYTSKEWTLCLLQSLDGQPVPQEDALRNAAEWARENLGLGFARLREDGVILGGLRAALEDAVKACEVIRRRGEIYRPADLSPEGAAA